MVAGMLGPASDTMTVAIGIGESPDPQLPRVRVGPRGCLTCRRGCSFHVAGDAPSIHGVRHSKNPVQSLVIMRIHVGFVF
jgi:hypothetical protein